MKTTMKAAAFAAMTLISLSLSTSYASVIEARIELGLSNDFFSAASGFMNGVDLSHTNTLMFTDGPDTGFLDITIEGFNAAGPAALMANNFALGVVGGDDDSLDAGESIRVTYNGFSGPAALSSIRLAGNFGAGDTFTYSGVGDASLIDDDTINPAFAPPAALTPGDSFTLTADTGSFRVQFFSHSVSRIPEPTTLALFAAGLLGTLATRRRA